LVYFVITSFRRGIGIHWPGCGWLPILVLLPLLHTRGRLSLLWMRIMLWSAIALTLLIHTVAHTPPSLLRKAQALLLKEEDIEEFEDERFGWREMGAWAEATTTRFQNDQGDKPRGVFVMSGQYGMSSALSFYIPGQPHVYLWAERKTHGENYRFWDDLTSLKHQDAIYVAKTKEKAMAAKPVLERHFEYVHEVESHPVRVDGDVVRSFYMIRCFIYDGVEPEF
jgi:hypothetical protein